MRFKFRLEKILHFFVLKEMIKKLEVAALNRSISVLQTKRIEKEKTLQLLIEKNNPNVEEEYQWSFYRNQKISFNARLIRELEVRIVEEKRKLDQKKMELLKITQRKRGLESLKDKRWKEFRHAQTRLEQKKLDELFQLTTR